MWYNPIITSILRSPLHGLVSGMYMLITFTGKKTGKAYTTPVQYRQQGVLLKLVTRRSRTWWKNLRGGAPVTLYLHGRDLKGLAEVLDLEGPALAAEIQAIYAPMVSAAQAARLAPESVVIQIRLSESTDGT